MPLAVGVPPLWLPYQGAAAPCTPASALDGPRPQSRTGCSGGVRPRAPPAPVRSSPASSTASNSSRRASR
ncbi:hypothetical protein EAO75_30295, partial [Streptomyces sp. uw30]